MKTNLKPLYFIFLLTFLINYSSALAQYECYTEGSLYYEYFSKVKYDGTVDNIPEHNPLFTGTVDHFDVKKLQQQVHPGVTTQYAIRYIGYLNIPTSGTYTFYILSDDGTKLFIDNELVIDNDGNSPVGGHDKTASLFLEKGLHAIKYLYYDAGGNQINVFKMSGPGFMLKDIPSSFMLNSGAGIKAIQNGDFQKDLLTQGWDTNPSDGKGWSSESKAPFYRAHLYYKRGSTPAYMSQEISVQIGAENTLSFDLGAISKNKEDASIEILINDVAYFLMNSDQISDAAGGDTDAKEPNKNMKTFSFSFTPVNQTVTLKIVGRGEGKKHDIIFLDNMELSSTGFCSSPSSGLAITNRKLTLRASKN
ncbi:MAG: PA14 domain-containing protein [Flavobacteriaceae bacterium]|jgi:hypothetical protein|nr:PA14 domain-containing protein [Flavobacteriaceae bacterium]MCI5089025.1 PA14 domain-containing protein [Flavobacteriaceae bacterium]CAI8175355.1 MAG: Uncharacterised protein [SAR116 cluster bacterium]